LYADIPEMVPTRNLPAHHRYIGPVLWSTKTPLPDWWNSLPADRPVIFLTLGSSGQAEILPMVLTALSRLPVTVIVATAGKIALADAPANAYITDYLPMDIATRRSCLVISNGGSLTVYQALSSGVPVLGLCSNMDQLLNMNSVEKMGAGITLRAAQVSATDLVVAVTAILNNPSYAHVAQRVGQILLGTDAGQCFLDIVAEILHNGSNPISNHLQK
jgi:UDP:flavonoid glycosyltransferase YjiC (YdhE family)